MTIELSCIIGIDGVMGVVAALCLRRVHAAIEAALFAARALVALTFKLDGAMTDIVFLAEHVGHRLQDRCAGTAWQIIN